MNTAIGREAITPGRTRPATSHGVPDYYLQSWCSGIATGPACFCGSSNPAPADVDPEHRIRGSALLGWSTRLPRGRKRRDSARQALPGVPPADRMSDMPRWTSFPASLDGSLKDVGPPDSLATELTRDTEGSRALDRVSQAGYGHAP